MTELVSCPTCRESLDIPVALLGSPVRCATCRVVFTPGRADAIPTAPRAMRVWERPPAPYPYSSDREPPAAKSNTWVWILLAVVALVFGVIVFGCAGMIRTMMNPEMTVHASDAGKFKVALPSPPATISRNDDGRPVNGLTAARPENQESYQVLAFDLPPNVRAMKTDDERLAAMAAAQLPALGAGAEVTREVTDHPETPTIDLLLHQQGGFFKKVTVLRVVIAGNRAYALSVQGVNLDPQMWWVRRFFSSFERMKKE